MLAMASQRLERLLYLSTDERPAPESPTLPTNPCHGTDVCVCNKQQRTSRPKERPSPDTWSQSGKVRSGRGCTQHAER